MTYLNVGVKGLNSKLHTVLHGIVKTQCVKKSQSHIKMLNTRSLHIYEQNSRYQDCRLCIDSHGREIKQDFRWRVFGASLSIFINSSPNSISLLLISISFKPDRVRLVMKKSSNVIVSSGDTYRFWCGWDNAVWWHGQIWGLLWMVTKLSGGHFRQ